MLAKYKFLLLTLLGILTPFVAFAARSFDDASGALDTVAGSTGHSSASLMDTVGLIINVAFSTVALVFLGLAIYAGVKWMTARGNQDSIGKAKDTLTNASIGLIVIVSGYAITTFVSTRVLSKASTGPSAQENKLGEEELGCCQLQVGAVNKMCSVQTKTQCDEYVKGKTIQGIFGPEAAPYEFTPLVVSPECEKLCQ